MTRWRLWVAGPRTKAASSRPTSSYASTAIRLSVRRGGQGEGGDERQPSLGACETSGLRQCVCVWVGGCLREGGGGAACVVHAGSSLESGVRSAALGATFDPPAANPGLHPIILAQATSLRPVTGRRECCRGCLRTWTCPSARAPASGGRQRGRRQTGLPPLRRLPVAHAPAHAQRPAPPPGFPLQARPAHQPARLPLAHDHRHAHRIAHRKGGRH